MAPRTAGIPGLALVAILVALPAAAKTLRTITVDGNLDDWTEVLLDRDQKIADRSQAQGDPDNPSQSQRDERGVAFTWDATNLYLYFSRTGAGTNSFQGVFYFDLGHDRLLQATDEIAFFKFTGSSFNGFDLNRYDDGGTPDAIGGDGVSPAGAAGALLGSTGGNAAVDPNGIAIEASVTWARLGVPAGTPLFIHPALSSNTNLPGGIQDNADVLDTFLVDVVVSQGTTKGTAPGRFIDFPHRVTNDATAPDVIDLILRTRLGFSVAVWSDPDGDGDRADGALLQLDANGDGDTTDAGDVAPLPAADTNGNSFVDGGALAAGASRAYVVRVGVPSRQALGSVEVVHIVAASSYRPSVRDEAEDVAVAGLLSVSPPRSFPVAAGGLAQLAHVACNESGAASALDLSFVSSLGWTVEAFSDPNGDGDPADGAPLPDTDGNGEPELGMVADAACVPFVLVVTVPAGALPGTREDLAVEVSDGTSVAALLDALDVVGARVDVRPDRNAKAQQGKTIYLQHEVRSAQSATDSFLLSVASTLGSSVAAMDDANDDSDPDGSNVVTTTGPLPGNGGRFPLLTRIRIPSTAVHGNVDLVTTEADSSLSLDFDTAVDTVDIAGLLSYSDALFAHPSTEFYGQCSTVHALAFRSGGGTYRFAWIDPLGVTRRISADLSPYSNGSLDDFFDCGPAPLLGLWTVKIQLRSGGSTYNDVGPSGTTTFELRDLVAGGARIALNDAGSDIYLLAGEALTAFADLDNPTSVDILGSFVEHVAFLDADGSGVPTAGEDYVLPDGSIGAWAPGLTTASRTGLDLYAGERSADRFVTAPVTYSQSGLWTVETRWIASCGFLLSVRTATFTVGCQPPPSFDGLIDAVDPDPCAHSGLVLSWLPATSWGTGTDGTYAVYRSTDPGFVPDASTLLVAGLTGTSHADASAAPGVLYSYVVRAESNVTCSDGPNNAGLVDANFVHVEATDGDAGEVPVADVTRLSPACVGVTVDFADASSGPPTAWAWDFDGDGVPDASGAAASWTFPSAGDWPVTLTVTNPCGSDTTTVMITVSLPPTAVIAASRPATCIGETVDLDALASSAVAPATIAGWAWDFDGDGVTDSTLADPGSIGWPTPGTWRVSLTVTDTAGCTATDSVDVEVHDSLQLALGAPTIDPCTGFTTLRATATGGDGIYTYVFSDLADDGTGLGSGVLPAGPHVETVTVTDGSGCTTQAPVSFDVLTAVIGSFVPTVTYIYPDQFQADLAASGGGGVPPYTFTWDVGADGSVDGTGPAISFGLTANDTVPVELVITDGNGCTAVIRQDVVSGGCPVDTPIQLLMVRKQGAGLAFSWQPSSHACHGRYELLEAATARPSGSRTGTWPTDPVWTTLTPEDADGSDLDPALELVDPRNGQTRYFLVRDGGTDGTFGPVESYGG